MSSFKHHNKNYKPKRGERYLNQKGEYCVITSIYKNIIRIRVCGEKDRTEIWKLEDFQNPLIVRFFRLPFPKTNRTNVARHLLEYQLNMIGKTTKDTKENPNWFKEWTISDREYYLFEKYAIPLLRKTFKCKKSKAIETLEWFNMQFGLKRKK